MREINDYYRQVVEVVCEEMETDPIMAMSSNKEECVDARGVIVCVLAKRLTEGKISKLTGLTRQAINRLKNIYPRRIEQSFYLFTAWRHVQARLKN